MSNRRLKRLNRRALMDRRAALALVEQGPTMESMENRQLMSVSVGYDPDGLGPIDRTLSGLPIPDLNLLNWSPSSAVAIDYQPVVGHEFYTLYHAKLSNFSDQGSTNRTNFADGSGNLYSM